MTTFQGSGFAIQLPEDVLDGSSYTFVKNDEAPVPPMLRITGARADAVPADMDRYLSDTCAAELAVNRNLEILSIFSHRRDSWHYGIVRLSWGGGPHGLREQRIYLFVEEPVVRRFVITVTASEANFEGALEYFREAVRSFTPNDVQRLSAAG